MPRKINYTDINSYRNDAASDFVKNMKGIKQKPYTGVGSLEWQAATRAAMRSKPSSSPITKAEAYTKNVRTTPKTSASVPSSVKNTHAKSNKPSTHTIKAGETLGSIAKKYGVDWRQLAKDNGIDNPNLIIAGRKLNINGATKQPRKRSRVSLQDQRPAPQSRLGISRTDVLKQLAPVGQPSDNVAPAYRGATNPYTDPRQLWI